MLSSNKDICVECKVYIHLQLFFFRSGVGAPRVGECDGDYYHDSRKSILEWRLAVIDSSNKTGSLEFSIPGQPDDFFPVSVNFVSKKSYCDIEVSASIFVYCCVTNFQFVCSESSIFTQ